MATTLGCSWSLVEFVGSFLMNPPVIMFIPFLNTQGRDGDKNFEETGKQRKTVFFKENRQNIFMEFLFFY